MLDDLQEHISDQHLHIIAPPGSGKTILGLEVVIRLNKPTLILAPTIAIRNQWIQRFCELFLQTDITPEWISKSVRNPKFMTVVTYQGLHAACNGLKEEDEETEPEEDAEENGNIGQENQKLENVVSGFKMQNIKVIVVDEAHHLKNEWWQTLTKVKETLEPIIVGLTATPPYDVTAAEWYRYTDLNGPVDTEISVPELVIEGDLCPHQDYVYFTLPTEKEHKNILDFRQNIIKLYTELISDETLIKAIENHPIWLDPIENLDWIYNNLSYYSACLIFLNANKKLIPETHLEVIGDKKFIIPGLDYNWMEILLDFYIFQEHIHFKNYQEHQKDLENKLKRFGALDRRQIDFSHNKRITGFLTSSISKMNGIKEIVDFEYKQLGKDLRMVILSDYIRKEFYVNTPQNELELNIIGVIPIFEKLRRENEENKKIGVLTGSMVIIPRSAYTKFELKAENYGVTKINYNPVPFDNNYILIEQNEQLKHEIVYLITQIFQEGEIEILIGTKSLLGEGWDAPAINSLILASFVGSFVLSNQMRGRAIRTQKGNENKTGNIWHLICIDPSSITGGDDLELLKRRFKGFVGISFKPEPSIENGIARLNLPNDLHQKEVLDKQNIGTFIFAGDRQSLKQRWKIALDNGVTLVEEIKIPFSEEKEYKSVKALYLNRTIANMAATLVFSLIGYLENILNYLLKSAKNIKTLQDLYVFLTVIGVGGVLFFGRQAYKTLWLYFKYRDISKDIEKIGDALLNTLIKANVIRTNNSELQVITSIDSSGSVFSHLQGGTTFERSTFINNLQEIVSPINNPKYVIVRKNLFMVFIKQKDYHSVPEIIGQKKNMAEYFKEQWKRLVGSCDLIYTRTIEGRKLLLKSRVKSLAAQFDKPVDHVNKWK